VYGSARAADCTDDAECKDGYHCETSTKKGKTTSKCEKDDQCSVDADCKDGYVCETSSKKGKTTSRCTKDKNYSECLIDADCKQGYHCEINTSTKKGKTTSKNKCEKNDECSVDADCKDGYACEITTVTKKGKTTTKSKCKKKKDKCDDGNACTTDLYIGGGQCTHTPVDGCVPCDTDGDCDDADACTTDSCNDGVCEYESGQCTAQCTTDADCADADQCTDEACNNGSCVITPIPGCNVPQVKEICGDCIDNDGNGLADFEDAACCGQTFQMQLKRGRISPKGAVSRLNLKSTLAHSGLTITPMKDDVYLQIRSAGASSDILCARIPAAKLMKKHKVIKYWAGKSPAASAQGIGDMKFKVRKDGSVKFKTFSKRVKLANARPGALQITVGFQNAAKSGASRCSSTMASFESVNKKSFVAK
jgi:hypothetical protein